MKPGIKTALKWTALAVGGFLLGAGAAWLQRPHTIQDTAPVVAPQVAGGKLLPPLKTGDSAETPQEPAGDNAAEDLATGTYAPEATDITATDSSFAEMKRILKPGEKEEVAEKPPEVKAEPMPPLVSGVKSAFTLKDHEGRDVTEKSWPGKYLLVFFGFTHCPDVCPVTLDKMTSVLNKLGDKAEMIQPLFITVDPKRDTEKVMKEYVGNFHKSILGLTGTPEQIKAAEDAFKVYAAMTNADPNGREYSFDHSGYVYLMTPEGGMAEIIRTQDKAADITDKIKARLEAGSPPPAP
jgi:cytochrome oxidase Cu insertion factor (SCO1/SenC/PrrC family)